MACRLVPADRVADIAELAEAVADEYCPTGRVEPLFILEQQEITSSFSRYGDYFDGMLQWDGATFHVFCNLDRVRARDSPRARFTLAHELGHYFIDEHRRALQRETPPHLSRCEFESDLPAEQEADQFAGSLLMPWKRFLRETRGAVRGLPGILRLAERFGTSITSTAIRYAESDLVPCTVLKWNPDGFGWKWRSASILEARFGRTVEAVDHVPKGSATAKALAGEPLPLKGYFDSGATVATWFPRVAHGESRNAILIEHAMPLGPFGAITVLFPDTLV